jgi:hypothetical protein
VAADSILIKPDILKFRKKLFFAIFLKDVLFKSTVSIDLHKN